MPPRPGAAQGRWGRQQCASKTCGEACFAPRGPCRQAPIGGASAAERPGGRHRAAAAARIPVRRKTAAKPRPRHAPTEAAR
eukprot:935636-Lingulodinium_polyedra.AAC.1